MPSDKNFLEGNNTYGLDFDDKILSTKEISYLKDSLKNRDKDKTLQDMINAINIV